MMSAHDIVRPEGGPLERSHMKGMVQRNTLESVAFTKITKHLETERKAFVRQSTRDEEEMKHLLHRLQFKQQPTLLDECDSDGDTFICTNEDDDDENIIVNPYPITIIPKFGAYGNNTKSTSSVSKLGHQSKLTRKKSGDYDEGSDTMSLMTSSSASISDANFYDVTPEWLASPNAISSVRRLRKTIPEQIQRKILIRGNSDVNAGLEIPASPVSTISHSRSNSLKERKKSLSSGDDTHSQRSFRMEGKRGGSLKERKHVMDEIDEKQLWRSYSMLTNSSLHEVFSKSDTRHFCRLSDRKQSTSETTGGSDVKVNTVGSKSNESEQNRSVIRKKSKKHDKTSLENKTK